MSISVIVMAAGKGTRMKSDVPKPLHLVRGRSLLAWVIHALDGIEPQAIAVVVGHGRDQVVVSLEADFDREFLFAEQLSPRGTGDAAAVGLAELDIHDDSFSDDDHVLILPGDTPLLTSATVDEVISFHLESGGAATAVTAVVDDPTGYGRIVRGKDGDLQAVVEHRDASAEQLQINEINASIYCFRRSLLGPALRMISTDNAQGEMYLTDAIGVLAEAGHSVVPFPIDPVEMSGVNDRAQLGAVTEEIAARIGSRHMRSGVTVVQPSSTVIDAAVVIEPDVVVHAGSVLEGATTVAGGAIIGPNSHLIDATIGERARVQHAVVRGASVAADATVGPFEIITD